ncbi:MAG: type II toxin-antitoxin system RelE/ParE family toxin [Verrucomicrobia bacterium]|jgi:toxin ParE1/3/4|nr:type II toxin-antitoxin system RelE/ParE family toxin [Verrucomicrobiota bacterium]MDA7667425.1 type II toxin-antitoxin system RelE/ParE family toxin [bacterium]
MSRCLIVRAEAETDISNAALWYHDREEGLELEFALEIRSALGRVVANPEIHPVLRLRPEVRRILTKRFPYRIFFIVRDDAIVIIAFVHAARLDRHWQKRV